MLGCCICVSEFALIGISSDALSDEWRNTPPPDDTTTGSRWTRNSRDRRIIYLVRNGPYSIIWYLIYCGLLLEALGSNVSDGFTSWIALVALIFVMIAYHSAETGRSRITQIIERQIRLQRLQATNQVQFRSVCILS